MQKPESHSDALPLYQQVKEYIVGKMNGGAMQPGMRIESEAELVARLKVSRMTVNRALRELADEGKINRMQGKGTFVAEKKPQSALLEIKSIAREIRDRGGVYSCYVHLLQAEKAQPSIAAALGLAPYSDIFHSIIVHKDSNIPIQLGCRYINPEIAPNFLEQDFTQSTVSDYLLQLAPISAVEHVVEALIPDPWIRDLLEINASEPCLTLHRKTWFNEKIATSSTFYMPGSRYSLGGKFTPTSPGSIGLS
jgi:GntR family transcriptional regulator, histidine utilization repressor